jgi:hypothetical protein
VFLCVFLCDCVAGGGGGRRSREQRCRLQLVATTVETVHLCRDHEDHET